MILYQTLCVYGIMICVMYYGAKKSKSLYGLLLIPTFVYAIIMGMRYGVGIDFFNYEGIYTLWSPFGFNPEINIEYGYGFLMSSCKMLGLSYSVFLFIISFFQISLIIYALKDLKICIPYICLAFILTGIGVISFTNGIRQCLAFSIFMLAVYFLSKKQYLLYILIVLLATTLHNSAIILLPILFFSWVKLDFLEKRVLALTPFVCIVLLFFNIGSNFFERLDSIAIALNYEKYLNRTELMNVSSNSFGLIDILYAIIDSYIIFNIKNIKKYFNKQSELIRIIYILWFIGIIGGTIFKGSMMLQRIFLYFTTFKFIMYGITMIYSKFNKHTKIDNLMFYFIIFTLFLRFSRIMYNASSYTADYVFYFQDYLHSYKHSIFF